MKNVWSVLIICLTALLVIPSAATARNQQIGVGAHYWTTLDDVDVNNIDESGLAWYLSYRNRLSDLLQVELDLEIADEKHAGAGETIYSPQAFLLLGAALYGGVGLGIDWADGELGNLYYLLRAGYVLELLPQIFVDFNLNYRFETWDIDAVRDDIDADTLTMGAIVRIGF